MEERLEKLKELWVKPVLKRKDIEFAENVSKQTAVRIMEKCRVAYGGNIPGRPYEIKTPSYFAYCGYTKEEWIRIASAMKGEKA